jgi:hypothetical protein
MIETYFKENTNALKDVNLQKLDHLQGMKMKLEIIFRFIVPIQNADFFQ